MTLNERIVKFQSDDAILRQWPDSDALGLVAACQAEIARLSATVTCGCGDVRLPADMCHLCGKCQLGCCQCLSPEEAAKLTTQLERAEQLLRNYSYEKVYVYFKEKEKP